MKLRLNANLGDRSDIVQLIYFSRVNCGKGSVSIERTLSNIINNSRENNSKYNITSALLTNRIVFAHVIEGPMIVVERLFENIIYDSRHTHITVLQNTLTHVRLFHRWPMAFIEVGDLPYISSLYASAMPIDRRKASTVILKALRPVLLG